MQIASDRLTHEHDIQHLIQMNRLNRLLHRIFLRRHQRQAVNFSRKFIITDKDVEDERDDGEAKVGQADGMFAATTVIEDMQESDIDQLANTLVLSLDLERNEQDRHIMFEVTGLKTNDSDRFEEDSLVAKNDHLMESAFKSVHAPH